LLAWLFARSTGRRFPLRIEDLDASRVRPGLAEKQLADLAALGVTFDDEPMVQSQRLAAYQRTEGAVQTIHDLLHGDIAAEVDDVVLVRDDGVPAYNLAVVVDDAFSGVDQVVRGDDLLPAAATQASIAELLGYPPPTSAHVPLAVNVAGRRLAKRDGAVTLRGLRSGT
jgi:glutamyl-tRNA synthetase